MATNANGVNYFVACSRLRHDYLAYKVSPHPKRSLRDYSHSIDLVATPPSRRRASDRGLAVLLILGGSIPVLGEAWVIRVKTQERGGFDQRVGELENGGGLMNRFALEWKGCGVSVDPAELQAIPTCQTVRQSARKEGGSGLPNGE